MVKLILKMGDRIDINASDSKFSSGGSLNVKVEFVDGVQGLFSVSQGKLKNKYSVIIGFNAEKSGFKSPITKGNMSTIPTMSSNSPSSKVSSAEKSQGTATNPKFCSECGAAVQSLNAKFCIECSNKLK